ncbi:hypothetical protein BO94DRAFT_617518 [Aspergillus sclerotioniger CBS 115572]|uniref:AB hydrolase-1 domain-containing protein n=1 Tax=Aspergillus sclerotioniger CBS 115572 TaxID=1450535 RepID=A0A317X2M8_9EURO|nr:hypothetical protein BO94DRAFT_617518 [Aspergillus sclerotioniger CBS 115572]PWY91872.1 hypothetical protein BO94DRAFT_617518 [Aspergillus sclerotioniger CBS 115572]
MTHIHPPTTEETCKRRLLLIYIHGFMGSEASFGDFPAHVHSSLKEVLDESHVIYTRIYPRYKSRGEISMAVENFRAWLSPHIADDLDVILLGHSLGGIVAADVALLSASEASTTTTPTLTNRTRILGLVNFDVPFLGLHPHVIPTGIRGLFRRKEDPTSIDTTNGIPDTATDALFDPPFVNDVHLVERDRINGIMHFIQKNHQHLVRSIYERVLSPYRFAGGLNNYGMLRRRYQRLMVLEGGDGDGSLSGGRVSGVVGEGEEGKVKRRGKGREEMVTVHDSALLETETCTVYASPSKSAEQLQFTNSLSTLDLSTDEDSTAASECSLEVTESSIQENNSIATQVDKATKKAPSKPHKFVLMPSHHWKHGDNSLWVPVQMENMDEVTAHQSMFVPHGDGRSYEKLIGEVVSQIESWVKDDLSERLLQAESRSSMELK